METKITSVDITLDIKEIGEIYWLLDSALDANSTTSEEFSRGKEFYLSLKRIITDNQKSCTKNH